MAVREESFRIGCGRYIQGKGYASKIGEEVMRLASSPLVIGGKTALRVAGETIEKSLSQKCNKYEIVVYEGTCNSTNAKEIAERCLRDGYDVITGVGGGVICDFAKLCAYYAKLPVINIPTSSATCAAYTPLSVCYTQNGETVGTQHYDYEVNCVIADTEIIGRQPPRLFISGVFDSLAKLVEIRHRYAENMSDYSLGLDYAYYMSLRSYSFLAENTDLCLDDMKNGIISDRLEKAIFSTIAIPGVISGVARGSNQTALGHKFYEMTRMLYPQSSKPYLHGEIVGVGLLMQNHYNGETQSNDFLINLMKKYNMPHSVESSGVPKSDSAFEEYYSRICNSSSIDRNNPKECEKFRKSLEYLWNIK